MNFCELPIAKLGSRDKRAVIEFVRVVTSLQNELLFAPAATNPAKTTNVNAAAESSLATLYAQCGPSDALKQIWAGILLELKQTLPDASYLTIVASELLDVAEGNAVIAMPAKMIDWAERQLRRKILSGLSISLKTKITALSFCPLA
jgi:hypothetical protein